MPEPTSLKRLGAGRWQTRDGRFTIEPQADLRHYDVDAKRYAVDAGKYEVQVGASSADIRARKVFTVKR